MRNILTSDVLTFVGQLLDIVAVFLFLIGWYWIPFTISLVAMVLIIFAWGMKR